MRIDFANTMGINNSNLIVQRDLKKATEKLSTGYTINRAADNASGLAISEKMRSLIRGLSMAKHNSEDGISLINTLLGMRINLKTGKPILKNVTGGLSGPAVFPVALRMVWQVYEAVSIPVVGLGGVSSADQVIEMMLAGASAVEIGTANLIDPFICPKILQELPAAMDRYGIRSLHEIVGGAHV